MTEAASTEWDNGHILDDEGSCWCEPEKIEEEDGVLWVHHAKEERN